MTFKCKDNAKRAGLFLPAAVILTVALVFMASEDSVHAQQSGFEVVYSPDVIEQLGSIIANPPSPHVVQYDDGEAMTSTTVLSTGNTHIITYDVYVDNVHDAAQSTTFTVTVVNSTTYMITDSNGTSVVTSNEYINADRTITLSNDLECVSTMQVISHGSARVYACYWQTSGAISISPTSGAIGWNGKNTIYIAWIPYYLDEVKINPWFIGTNPYYSTSTGGSLTFPGIYSAHDTYEGRVIFYYEQ